MAFTFDIDDFNTSLIQYTGSWDAFTGSTRQWDGTVHSTGQAGATATFQFRGTYLCQLFNTQRLNLMGHRFPIDGLGNYSGRSWEELGAIDY
jgi:hypothetical protein